MVKDIFMIELLEEGSTARHLAGFYFDYDEAVRNVKRNYLDLADGGRFKYCCIRPYEEGIHAYQRRQELNWFYFDDEDGWMECDKPRNGG